MNDRNRLPVSRRFYKTLMLRINGIAELSPTFNLEHFRDIIDKYIRGESFQRNSLSEMERVVFALVSSEIDRAKDRSIRARIRANERKLARLAAEREHPENGTPYHDRLARQAERRARAEERRRIRHQRRIERRAAEARKKLSKLSRGVSAPADAASSGAQALGAG